MRLTMMKVPALKIVSVLALSVPVVAQEAALTAEDDLSAIAPTTEAGRDVKFSIGAGAIYQSEADTEASGEFNVTRFTGALGAQTDLSDDLGLSIQLNYGLDLFDFEGPAPLGPGGEPWEDIHTISATALLTWAASDELSIFGGPVAQVSREFEADWDDGFTAGGVIGASYTFKNGFTLGGGLVIVSQIEDNVRVDPILIVNYALTDELRLASQTGNALRLTGVELVYGATQGVELAIGIASQFLRFRLDDDGVAPGGVGEDESLPFWVRASYDMNPNVRINGLMGFNTMGEMRLEDANGSPIDSQEYDAALFVGVSVNFRF